MKIRAVTLLSKSLKLVLPVVCDMPIKPDSFHFLCPTVLFFGYNLHMVTPTGTQGLFSCACISTSVLMGSLGIFLTNCRQTLLIMISKYPVQLFISPFGVQLKTTTAKKKKDRFEINKQKICRQKIHHTSTRYKHRLKNTPPPQVVNWYVFVSFYFRRFNSNYTHICTQRRVLASGR